MLDLLQSGLEGWGNNTPTSDEGVCFWWTSRSKKKSLLHWLSCWSNKAHPQTLTHPFLFFQDSSWCLLSKRHFGTGINWSSFSIIYKWTHSAFEGGREVVGINIWWQARRGINYQHLGSFCSCLQNEIAWTYFPTCWSLVPCLNYFSRFKHFSSVWTEPLCHLSYFVYSVCCECQPLQTVNFIISV